MTVPLARLISSAKEPGWTLLTMTPPLMPSLQARAAGMAVTVMPSLPSADIGLGGRGVLVAGAGVVGEELGAVGDGDTGGVALAVAQVA